ncbi:MAG TPA: YdcF family protein [Chthoniobacteraceae bacterium]|nr:YdcF family protein [Chthoniobacteraceae bacterium]
MKIGKITKRLLLLVAAMALVFLTGTGALVWSGLHDDIQKADVALVLGNTVLSDGTPSARLKARLDRTLELYRDGDFPLVVVSGGIGKESFDEAAVMKRYLVANGIPAEQIIADNQGVTTYASAKNLRRILDERKLTSVLVVSQYFHIPRSRLALKKVGIEPVHSAHAQFFEARDVYSIARELVGYLDYAVRK